MLFISEKKRTKLDGEGIVFICTLLLAFYYNTSGDNTCLLNNRTNQVQLRAVNMWWLCYQGLLDEVMMMGCSRTVEDLAHSSAPLFTAHLLVLRSFLIKGEGGKRCSGTSESNRRYRGDRGPAR